MSEHFLEGETVRVDYPDGAWIDIVEEFTQEDNDYITGKMVNIRGQKGKGKDAKTDMEFKIGRMAVLERAVRKWSFPEPINPDTLSRLRIRYREPLLAKIDELAAAQSEWLEKNYKTASLATSTEA